ncbi:tetratricopeptide repeat protein [candidate division KSB1 bacterium]
MKSQYMILVQLCILFLFANPTFAQEELKKKVQVYVELEQYREAIDVLEEILAGNPGDIESMKQIARLYGYIKEYDKSIEIINQLLERYPNDYDIIFGRAQIFSWKQEYLSAENDYKRIISESPGYIDAYIGLARIYLWQNDFDKSFIILEKAQDVNPANQEVLLLKAQAYNNSGDYRKAKKYSKLLIENHPESETGLELYRNIKIYSFETGGGYEALSTRTNWHEERMVFLYKPHRKFTAIFSGANYYRFEMYDRELSMNYYLTLTDNFTIQGLAGLGTSDKFIPSQRYNLELAYSVKKITLTAGGNLLHFPDEDIKIYIGGVTFYLPSGIFSEYRYYSSSGDKTGESKTHLMKLNYLKENRFSISIGFATGGEAFHIASREELAEVDSRSYIGMMTYYFSRSFGLRLGYSHTDRENSYTRKTVTSSLIFNF